MFLDNKILIGKDEADGVYLLPKYANRHGVITGATGTGKTVTLKVLIEGLSDCGVPCFVTDIKGDVSGLGSIGSNFVLNRANEMELPNFSLKSYPVCFYDVYGELGHPIRCSVMGMGALVLASVLELSDAQAGVLAIAFQIAKDKQLHLDNLDDLKACLQYVYDHNDELSLEYGNVAKQSVSAILRNLLVLKQQGGDNFFGLPEFNLHDLMRFDGVNGLINILDCQKLFLKPNLYVAFLLWLLNAIYELLPEVGDLDKPKLVLFFDEAHLIFKENNKALLDKLEQVIKLIRSKGVGIFFCTQNPRDISDNVLAQLSNRIQHGLRAYTPNEIKAVKLAADSFRANPKFDTSEIITLLKTGQALVSCLDESGAPNMVAKTKICPPSSSMEAIDDSLRSKIIKSSLIYGKYEQVTERDSAFEILNKEKEANLEKEKLAKENELLNKEKQRLEAQKLKEQEKREMMELRQQERERERSERRNDYYKRRALGNVTSTVTREVTKGILNSIKKLFK